MSKLLTKYFKMCQGALLVGTVLALTGCSNDSDSDYAPVEVKLTPAQTEIVRAENSLGLKLMHAMVDDGKNLLLSPASLNTAMYMMANDAVENEYIDPHGMVSSRSDLIEFLGYDRGTSISSINDNHSALWRMLTYADKQNVDIISANSAWSIGVLEFPEELSPILQASYNAGVFHTEASKIQDEINRFFARNSKGMIKEFKLGDNIQRGLLFANALYFSGQWKNKFDAAETADANFTNADGSTSKVRMMRRVGGDGVGMWRTEDYDALSLPYGNGSFEMLLVLPAEGKKLADVLRGIDAEAIAGDRILGEGCTPDDIRLPKFSIDGDQLDLFDVMREKLNLPDIWLGVAGNKAAPFNFAKQKVSIKVDESGSKAAAATVVGNLTGSFISHHASITFDRPFGFFVREKVSGAIVVMGAVNRL